jgi:hypothetical protein
MELLFLLNYIKWIQNVPTFDLGFNAKTISKILQIDIIGKSLADVMEAIESPNSIYF